MRVLSILLSVAVLGGCTKKREYDTLLKENDIPKSLIEGVYLYLPSVNETARHSPAARPHWMGQEKLVRFQFLEKALMVYEIETDPRFSKNPTNKKPVMAIPISHNAYRCAENDHGECTNKEEKNDDISWNEKPYFKPDLSDMNLIEVNLFPLALMNLFDGCFQTAATKVTGFDIDETSINFDLEVAYKTNGLCIWDIESLSDLTFSVRNHYSFTKLSSIASSDYEPVIYPQTDESEFGYFSTEKRALSVDNNDEVRGEKVFMNRWNPKRKEIVYFLSDEFSKPEHAKIREATFKGIETINGAFKEAGTDLRIVLKDAHGKSSGDLRNSMIVLVEDPQSVNVIGYGPSATNPLTGEIVHGRVVMYLGTMMKFIKRSYEEIIEESKRAGKVDGNAAALASAGGDSAISSAELSQIMIELNRNEAASSVDWSSLLGVSGSSKMSLSGLKGASEKVGIGGSKWNSAGIGRSLSKETLQAIRTEMETLKVEASPKFEDVESILARHNVYTAENVNFEMAVVAGVNKIFGGKDHLKPWNDLTEDERQSIIEVVMPMVWTPTLIHEVGHTLGLRHNFSGSHDKKNYYTKEELAQKGLEPVDVPYSSVMDYSYRTLNELHTLGKYDVAALRFGYARQVETEDGKFIPVETTLADFLKQRKMERTSSEGIDPVTGSKDVKLKVFDFCTDEHVALNASCARFDEGSNFVEQMSNLMESYDLSYKRNNFRNGRRNFSMLSESSYASRIDYVFGRVRLFFELFDRISKQYGVPADSQEWSNDEFLADLRKSVDMANDFLIGVLKTPAQHCLVKGDIQGNPVVAPLRLPKFAQEAINCFDDRVSAYFSRLFKDNNGTFEVVLAEAGKSFESKKDIANDNPYADQIDVQGIWVDKLLAAHTLLSRKAGLRTLDRIEGNFLDHNGLLGKEDLLETLRALVLDEAVGELFFAMPDGKKLVRQVPLRVLSTHFFQEPMSQNLKKALELTEEDGILSFQKELLRIIDSSVVDPTNIGPTGDLLANFQVYRSVPEGLSRELVGHKSGSRRFYASKENTVAMKCIERAPIADTVLELQSLGLSMPMTAHIIVKRVLSNLPRTTVESVAKVLQSGKPTSYLSEEEMRVYNLGKNLVHNYLYSFLGLSFIPSNRLLMIEAALEAGRVPTDLSDEEQVAYKMGAIPIRNFLNGETGLPRLEDEETPAMTAAMKVEIEMLRKYISNFNSIVSFHSSSDYEQILSILPTAQ